MPIEQKISIQNSTNLSDEEVERMKKDAEAHAEEDKARRELIEAKNKASGVAHELEKQLKDYGDKVDEKDRKEIEENVKKLQEMAAQEEGVTVEALEKAIEETFASAQKLGEAMNKQQAPGAEAKPEEGEEKKDGEEKKSAEEGEVVNE